jgi:2-methylcitrate dehydratase PrpD
MLELISAYSFKPEDVKRIKCDVNYRVPQDLIYHNPKTGGQARFSLQFCIAAALLEGRVDLDLFEDEKISDPRFRRFFDRVEMNVPPELQTRDMVEGGYTRVTVELTNGQKHQVQLGNSSIKGFPSNPLTRDELLRKYRNCARRSDLTEEQIGHSIDLIEHLEGMGNIKDLMDTLRVSRS